MYAGRFRRFVAYFFDSIIITGLLYLTVMLIEFILKVPSENSFTYLVLMNYFKPLDVSTEQAMQFIMYDYIVKGVIWLLYETLFVFSPLGATPGKLALRMEVVSYRNGNFFKVLIRTIVKIFLIMTIVGVVLEFLVMLFNKKKRTLHDFMAGTYVIKNESEQPNYDKDYSKELVMEELNKGNIKTYGEQISYMKSIQKRSVIAKKRDRTGLWWFVIFIMMFVPAAYMAMHYDIIAESQISINDNYSGVIEQYIEFFSDFRSE
jgi:uncharacterized RDD family membrane protein YckC